MIIEILADVLIDNHWLNTNLLELCSGSDTRYHQQLRGVECSHADNDLVSCPSLADESGSLINVAYTESTRIRTCRVEECGIARWWCTYDDTGDRGIVQHPQVCAVPSLLVEAIVTATSPQHIVDGCSTMLDADTVASVQILHNWNVQSLRASNNEAICRRGNITLEAKFKRAASVSACIECLEILAEGSERICRVRRVHLRALAEEVISVVPSPSWVA